MNFVLCDDAFEGDKTPHPRDTGGGRYRATASHRVNRHAQEVHEVDPALKVIKQ